MALFIFGGVLVLLTMAALLHPLLRRAEKSDAADRESAIYQDQLAEIDRDLARGVLTAPQAAAARHEIERRLLGALRRRDADQFRDSRLARMAIVAGVAISPLVVGTTYLLLGAPDLPAAPFSERPVIGTGEDVAALGSHAEMRERIAALEARLAATPNDLDGQALLARSYASIGQYREALTAYDRANRLAEGRDRRLAGEYAEAMVLANDGQVSEAALQTFVLIQEDTPGDPQSAYYIALHKAQTGRVDDALADLSALIATAPADAPWRGTVAALITELGGTAPPPPLARAAPGPTPEMMEAAAAMTDEERAAMIQSMVDGLAARLAQNPDDLGGWQRLARAYEVLGETEKAATAFAEVQARAPNDPAAAAFFAAHPDLAP